MAHTYDLNLYTYFDVKINPEALDQVVTSTQTAAATSNGSLAGIEYLGHVGQLKNHLLYRIPKGTRPRRAIRRAKEQASGRGNLGSSRCYPGGCPNSTTKTQTRRALRIKIILLISPNVFSTLFILQNLYPRNLPRAEDNPLTLNKDGFTSYSWQVE
ncbi:hypothetical protein BCR41DRAFT_370362 [Lobosporangium transversale]|uniref:Uncharacterized protein n=1 Tax=Lobosporangium transversale TaxID=64571 RepID=A0A1Y2GPC7_9FUNG|nr:hypothetical protein BCR41DRAFT_370362 [Lobosporangium transversale]ORZ17550.1 hypothetical protein BCR41DRAFT_370362 [Lobosporangium transversale]|eukprot:XP_021881937.1 hypothetical protein BCR41DRAFT_370362 [Lobosporangium transversale]